jgi:hypothetical protein
LVVRIPESRDARNHAITLGYESAWRVGAVITVGAFIVALLLIRRTATGVALNAEPAARLLRTEMQPLPNLSPNPEFAAPASRERLDRAAAALNAKNIQTEILPDGAAAHDAVMALLPEGSEVHVALSETMREIGLTQSVEEGNYHAIRPQLMKMDRQTQRREMAKLASAPDYMLGSVHAVTEEGDLVIGSGTGSQLGPYANAAGTLILVAGAQKVVRDVEEGLRRLREYSYPMEDARMKASGAPGTILAKTLIMQWDVPGRTHLFLVGEPIGF